MSPGENCTCKGSYTTIDTFEMFLDDEMSVSVDRPQIHIPF